MVKILFLFLVSPFLLFLLLFFIDSIRERQRRASTISALAWLFVLSGTAVVLVYVDQIFLLWSLNALLLCSIVGGALPLSKMSSITFTGEPLPYDERDIMFARARYRPGTPEYQEYYSRHPERQLLDDELRALPELLEPGGARYEAVRAKLAQTYFEANERLIPFCEGNRTVPASSVDPHDATRRLKQLARDCGAVDVGVAELHPGFLYTHVGRGPGGYGTPIHLDHTYVLVYAVEMDADVMRQAPRMPVVVESAARYLHCATIGIPLAATIRHDGYDARAHTDANYRLLVPAAAVAAGLGEVGRLGYLLHPRYGARVRLGAVTTTMPLVPDAPTTFGVQDFCRICKKCTQQCPAGAISFGEEKLVRGVHKWSTNQEACYKYWRTVGTDCGICMHVCPYSRPATFTHNIIRLLIRRNAIARRLAVWADKLIYPPAASL